MTKKVTKSPVVEVKGRDSETWVVVDHAVTKWEVIGEVGEIATLVLTVVDSESVISINANRRGPEGGPGVSTNAIILLGGVDISNWVYGWDHMVRVGKTFLYRLYLHADSSIFRINGTAPWDEGDVQQGLAADVVINDRRRATT